MKESLGVYLGVCLGVCLRVGLGVEGGGCSRDFSIRVMSQDPSKTQTKNMVFEKFGVVVGGGWVVGVSVIIASALVLLRQELRPVLENSLGQ